MLDFICPTCGQFSFDDEACVSCQSPVAEDLVA